jgi:hypothetical protein
MATPTRKSLFKVLQGRVETRAGKREVAAEAGEPIELSDEAAAKLVARGIVAPMTRAEAATATPVAAAVSVTEPTGGPTVTTAPAAPAAAAPAPAPAPEATPAAAPAANPGT